MIELNEEFVDILRLGHAMECQEELLSAFLQSAPPDQRRNPQFSWVVLAARGGEGDGGRSGATDFSSGGRFRRGCEIATWRVPDNLK